MTLSGCTPSASLQRGTAHPLRGTPGGPALLPAGPVDGELEHQSGRVLPLADPALSRRFDHVGHDDTLLRQGVELGGVSSRQAL